MKANIAKIFKQTEGIEQIKKDLKALNDLANRNKDDHKLLLDIKGNLTKYRENNDKLTAEVDRHTKDIETLKATVKDLVDENKKLRSVLTTETGGYNLGEQINQQILRNEQKYQLIIEGMPENRAEDPVLTARQLSTHAGVNITLTEIDSA